MELNMQMRSLRWIDMEIPVPSVLATRSKLQGDSKKFSFSS